MPVTAAPSAAWGAEALPEGFGTHSIGACHSQREVHDLQQQPPPHLHHQQQQENRLHYVWPGPPPPSWSRSPRSGQHAGPSVAHVSTQTTDCAQPVAMELDDGEPQHLPPQQQSGGVSSAPPDAWCRSGDSSGDREGGVLLLSPSSTSATCEGDDVGQLEGSCARLGSTRHAPLCCFGQGCQTAILKRIVSSSDPNAYSLLGPVSCSELYTLANLLRQDMVGVQWLYVAVQDPYRKCEFSQRATHAIADLADALAANKRLRGLILRMPQSELGTKQLKRIVGAFTHTLQSNRNLTSLQFKPPGFFCQQGTDFEPLVEAGKLPEECRVAFLSGTHPRLGAKSAVSLLPQEVLQRIVDYCSCSVV